LHKSSSFRMIIGLFIEPSVADTDDGNIEKIENSSVVITAHDISFLNFIV